MYSFVSPIGTNLSDKEIKKIYKKRRQVLKRGYCFHCCHNLKPIVFESDWFPERKGEILSKGGITKDKRCPHCGTDLIEFCFQDLLDEARHKAKEIYKEKPKKKVKKKAKPKGQISLW